MAYRVNHRDSNPEGGSDRTSDVALSKKSVVDGSAPGLNGKRPGPAHEPPDAGTRARPALAVGVLQG